MRNNRQVRWLLKHKTLILEILAGVLFVSLGVSVFLYYRSTTALKQDLQEQTDALNAQIAANNRSGYVALTDINQGDILQDGVNVSMATFASGANVTTFATADCIGKQAVVDIPANTPITTNIVATEMPKQMNERECTFINLSANLLKGDFVDVRILFPNGEDYIVVSKVAIQNPVIASNIVYLWLQEHEILNLDGAIVDANLHGAMIYTTKYIEPEVQPANTVTYQPNEAVIALMQKDPNIVQEAAAALSVSARQSIEDRLKAFEKAYPDFELKLDQSEDTSEALKAIAGGAATGTTAQPTPTPAPATESTETSGDTGQTDSTAENDTTVTYGN